MSRDRIAWMRTLFPASPSRGGCWQPFVDVYRTARGWLIKCDLAGVPGDDVGVAVQGRHVTVRGTRRDCCLDADCSHYLLEIAYSHFERTIELPELLDRSAVTTEFRQGMLLVRIEREAKP